VAALDMLLDYGPEGYTYQPSPDIYAVYGSCRRRHFWILVGVPWPGRRQLLPLEWGTTAATSKRIADAAAQATEKLRKWRGA
jgi:hypothetical protein